MLTRFINTNKILIIWIKDFCYALWYCTTQCGLFLKTCLCVLSHALVLEISGK